MVIPFLGPAEELAGTLAALGATGSVIVVDDGCADPGAVARWPAGTGPRSCATPPTRGRERPATPAGGSPRRRWSRSSTAAACPVDGWLADAAGPPRRSAGRGGGAADHRRVPASLPGPWRPTNGTGRRWTAGRTRAPCTRAAASRSCPSAALLVRRSDLEQIGGFDERPAVGRGRRPRVAAGGGGAHRPLRAGRRRPPRRPAHHPLLAPPAVRLRELRGPAGPAPRRGGPSAGHLGPGGRRVGARHGRGRRPGPAVRRCDDGRAGPEAGCRARARA